MKTGQKIGEEWADPLPGAVALAAGDREEEWEGVALEFGVLAAGDREEERVQRALVLGDDCEPDVMVRCAVLIAQR